MKTNSIYALLLTFAALVSSACYRAEVRASRPTTANTERPVATDAAEKMPNTNKTSTDDARGPATNANTMDEKAKKDGFRANLPAGFEMPADAVGMKLLQEYGSVCLASNGATAPPKILFRDESEVSSFHARLATASESIGGFRVELQAPAMAALKRAMAEAQAAGRDITPRGPDSAKRTYAETVKLWESRVTPGLAHWVAQRKLAQSEADRIKSLAPFEQVPEILKLEAQGLFFAKDLSKSILYSVAAPGASQHLHLLALDIQQFADPQVRAILARHGWFQTVQSDLPHFTYLGVSESELPRLGLRSVTAGGQKFWVPNI